MISISDSREHFFWRDSNSNMCPIDIDWPVPRTLNLVKNVADLRLMRGNISRSSQNGQVFCKSQKSSKVDGGPIDTWVTSEKNWSKFFSLNQKSTTMILKISTSTSLVFLPISIRRNLCQQLTERTSDCQIGFIASDRLVWIGAIASDAGDFVVNVLPSVEEKVWH